MYYYDIIISGDEEWWVDWAVVERLVRAYWSAVARNDPKYTREVHVDRAILPDIVNVETDWEKVRADSIRLAHDDICRYFVRCLSDMRYVAHDVLYKVRQTGNYHRAYGRRLQAAQHVNSANIAKSVENLELAKEVTKFVRDTSFDSLSVGAAIVTGGAGLAWLAGASFLKGSATFVDTIDLKAHGDWENGWKKAAPAGMAKFGGELALGAFKLGGAGRFMQNDAVLVVAKGAVETATSFAAGEDFGAAVKKGLVKTASDRIGKILMDNSAMHRLLNKMPIPGRLTFKEGTHFDFNGLIFRPGREEFIHKSAEKFVARATKVALPFGLEQLREKLNFTVVKVPVPQVARPSKKRRNWASEAFSGDDKIVFNAIINRELGIEGGW